LAPLGVHHVWVGIPLHFPFLFLAALTSVIQSLIFSLLACIYVLLMPAARRGGAFNEARSTLKREL